MKVSGRKPSTLQQTKTKNTAQDKLNLSSGTKKTANKADIAAASKLNLSSRAQKMNEVKEMIKKQPDVNEAKVDRIQKMIDSGEYKIDAQGVADRLVDEHLLFPS